jgi:hypothetical protein
MPTSFQVVIDCGDPARVARFWAEALGYVLQPPPAGHDTWEAFLAATGVPEADWNRASAVVDPEGKRLRLYFQRVPEGKVVKNRVHMDLNVGGGSEAPLEVRRGRVDAEVERLGGLGARVVRPVEEWGEYWVVMQDPEGNEFCVQ